MPDFLPRPEDVPSLDELAGKTGGQTKITQAIDDDTLEFFRAETKKRKTSYQRMLRNLVRAYVHTKKQNARAEVKSVVTR